MRRLRSRISVPKLQLMAAATLLIQMNGLTERKYEGRIGVNSVIFCTDPAIVPKYILVENRFITFFAVIGGWRHIRSKLHPADYAFKRLKPSETEKLDIWKHDPNFLRKDLEEWPQQPADLQLQLSDHNEGVKRKKIPTPVFRLYRLPFQACTWE